MCTELVLVETALAFLSFALITNAALIGQMNINSA